ncbi:hypothetical protein AAHA92_29412 [Salvia divinorum]|uniref:Uncharacterized protein n=1 Tax=Salvia divinorum TaxID=28513 RepID=A0ABD1G0X0_SALDI
MECKLSTSIYGRWETGGPSSADGLLIAYWAETGCWAERVAASLSTWARIERPTILILVIDLFSIHVFD